MRPRSISEEVEEMIQMARRRWVDCTCSSSNVAAVLRVHSQMRLSTARRDVFQTANNFEKKITTFMISFTASLYPMDRACWRHSVRYWPTRPRS
ncbi:hypothetical protein TRIATDRAFT_300535 [Trichoderma atroviride IMI 206040]|uniref:Uncharacterized protein n=1 Tax=Hypocrea atroviridis (strain ATCC 20476 / IMI 206040) TaxID=452589 RepID=G9NXT3_HYPAI|nr:uncharacterized protein TRIATDRAFT_300535 [Trichoderma atroviride IMI 206040]EHK44262.1 hypothetical protein TRIATDRAFT_300535 [Trichoderma atroviride IMI 206040]